SARWSFRAAGTRASPRPPRSRSGPGFATPAALAEGPGLRHARRARGGARASPRPPRSRGGPPSAPAPPRSRDAFAALNIEVQRELPRVRTEPHRVHLVLALVLDPRLDHVRGEDVALQQPVVGFLEVVEHDAEVT